VRLARPDVLQRQQAPVLGRLAGPHLRDGLAGLGQGERRRRRGGRRRRAPAQLRRVQVVGIEARRAGLLVPRRAGAQRLRVVEAHVHSVAHLLHGALGQQVDVLVVRVVVVLCWFRQHGLWQLDTLQFKQNPNITTGFLEYSDDSNRTSTQRSTVLSR